MRLYRQVPGAGPSRADSKRCIGPALSVQTPEYARSVLSKKPHATDDEIENLLGLRLTRQDILTRDGPPLVCALLDEAVLNRPIGPTDVMRGQLLHLADLATWPNISIQVIPYSAGGHIGLLGAFVIAEAADMSATVFLENAADGQTVEDIDHLPCCADG